MSLHGSEMDESTHPIESGLEWTIAWEPVGREFIGRDALDQIRRRGGVRKMVGLVLEGREVLRRQQRVIIADSPPGVVTSGTFSPTMQRSIGLARVPMSAGSAASVEIRGKLIGARVVKPPFVRNGVVLV
jgi:aminomethyltransferase